MTGEAVANGQLRAAAEFEPSMDLHVTAGYTSFATNGALYSGNLSEANRTEASLFWRPGWMNGMLYIQGNGLHSAGPASAAPSSGSPYDPRGPGALRPRRAHDALTSISAPTTGDVTFDASADVLVMGP